MNRSKLLTISRELKKAAAEAEDAHALYDLCMETCERINEAVLPDFCKGNSPIDKAWRFALSFEKNLEVTASDGEAWVSEINGVKLYHAYKDGTESFFK